MSGLKKYLVWMAVNSWANSTLSVISTGSMLNSIMCTPSYTSAVVTTYIGKDIFGQLGSLGYAWKTGKQADKNQIKYITNGSLILQLSYYLENASILITAPDLVLPFLGTSSAMKNISFITIGAANASILQKLSHGKQIGEFYSKVTGINTLSSSLGMLTGIGILNFIPSYEIRTYVVMPLLTAVAVYSIRRASSVAMQD